LQPKQRKGKKDSQTEEKEKEPGAWNFACRRAEKSIDLRAEKDVAQLTLIEQFKLAHRITARKFVKGQAVLVVIIWLGPGHEGTFESDLKWDGER